jgi:2-oxoglutarate dehydrogenase E2 component (dihydrolipoamide succinyltransferase)
LCAEKTSGFVRTRSGSKGIDTNKPSQPLQVLTNSPPISHFKQFSCILLSGFIRKNGDYMSLEVVMPQMGESITEGTVSKWLKQVGEKVEKDESILEISTDKVDAEVPSPGAGVLLEIRTKEGETVEVGTVVAVIGDESDAGTGGPGDAETKQQVAETPKVEETEPAVKIAQEAPAPTATESNPQSAIPNPQSQDATEVVMPQMGESITEGTVSKWLKTVGEKVDKDEPLLEISTDKVDAEVPSPASGTLLEIKVNEGETVEVGSVVALVGAEGAATVSSPESKVQSPKPVETPKVEEPKQEVKAAAATVGNGQPATDKGQMTLEDLRRTKSSPLVRNIAKEHGVDISQIPGSGLSGRVTKKDIMSFIDSGAALKPQDLLGKTESRVESRESRDSATPISTLHSPLSTSSGDRIEPMSVMRKKIAEHMTFSKQTSAHVTSVYEFDMTNVAKFREKNKAEFQARYATKLTYMPFIFQAVTQALRQFPVVNSQVSGEQIVYKGDINLGMAVALDWGLIVPVIKRADQLSLSGLALAANDLADRARQKKLMPDEVGGGTFTITNPGVFGGLFGTPIINQPQVAILCVGTIEKRPKVLTTPDGDDYLAIRTMAYFALTYDHRIVDGADAERFLSFMKNYLETTPFSL